MISSQCITESQCFLFLFLNVCCLLTKPRTYSVTSEGFFSFIGCSMGYSVLDALQCFHTLFAAGQSLVHVCNSFAEVGRLTSEGDPGTSSRII